jgi:hypothetical protein
MPGQEFGIADMADAVEAALRDAAMKVDGVLGGGEPGDIVSVACGKSGSPIATTLSEREWRLIYFALNRAAGWGGYGPYFP